jgi:hypothetical protein
MPIAAAWIKPRRRLIGMGMGMGMAMGMGMGMGMQKGKTKTKLAWLQRRLMRLYLHREPTRLWLRPAPTWN